MGASTGPILAAGAISAGTATLRSASPDQLLRIGVATGIAAGGLALVERGVPRLAVGLAWAALITTLFLPTGGPGTSPAEVFLDWLDGGPVGSRFGSIAGGAAAVAAKRR